jgi:hypothetical protein
LSCAGHAVAQTLSRPEALLKKMTLDEKIGQLVQRAGGRSKTLNSKLGDAEMDRVRAGQVGSYLHVAGAAPLAKLQKVAVEESRLGIPLLFATDVLHGYRTIFRCHWRWLRPGRRRARNVPLAWGPKRQPPLGCIGLSLPSSTSRAIRVGAASSKVLAKIRTLPPAWRSRR